jgi:hypothetical protein
MDDLFNLFIKDVVELYHVLAVGGVFLLELN